MLSPAYPPPPPILRRVRLCPRDLPCGSDGVNRRGTRSVQSRVGGGCRAPLERQRMSVEGDSKLVVEQMRGNYKVILALLASGSLRWRISLASAALHSVDHPAIASR